LTLPVELTSFTASTSEQGITLKWRTATETNNLGFNIYRSDRKDGKYININAELIAGAGTNNNPHYYKYVDATVVKGLTYYYYIEDVDLMGNTDKSRIIVIKVIDKAKPIMPALDSSKWVGMKAAVYTIPMRTALRQNFPNPFNPETWMPYQLSDSKPVTIRIHDAKGQLIRILDLGERQAGYYVNKSQAAYWDGKNTMGQSVSSGVYFYHLKAGNFSAVRKMVIMK